MKGKVAFSPPFAKGEGVRKLGLSDEQEYLQSFTNAVIWKAKVTRLCGWQ